MPRAYQLMWFLLVLPATTAVAGGHDINEFCGQVFLLDSTVVRCHDPGVGTEELVPLEIMPGIEELDISGTRVKDLSFLRRFGSLRKLDISRTPVVDLEPLHDMEELQVLVLGNVQVEESQIRALVMANPGIALKGVRDDYTILRPVNLSLTSTIGTNGRASKRATNWLSLGLLGARTARLYGLGLTVGNSLADEMFGVQLSLMSNIVTREAVGAQLALVANKAGSVTGIQLAGVVNRTNGNRGIRGIQAAGLLNLNQGRWKEGTHPGIQIAGLFNIGGRLQGIQLAGLMNWREQEDVIGIQAAGLLCSARDMWGVQLSAGMAAANKSLFGLQVGGLIAGGQRLYGLSIGGLTSAAGDEVVGVQMGGLLSYSRNDVIGAQIGGLGSIVRRDLCCLQAAGLGNLARNVIGLQIGGGNFAWGEVTGVQVGLVNFAGKVHGLQLGIVNIADEVEGFSLGLFNWVDTGDIELQLFADDRAPFNAALEYGSGRIYTLVSGGFRPLGDRNLWNLGLGLGGRIVEGTFFANVDLTGGNVRYDLGRRGGRNIYFQLRLMGGYRPSSWLSLFGGASFNLHLSMEGHPPELALGDAQVEEIDDDLSLSWWVGVFGGMRFGLKPPP